MNFKKRVNGSWVDTPNYIHKTDTDTFTTLPANIYPNATTATVGLSGNMQQSGTPTPDNPIQPSETGEMSRNMFDAATAYGDMYNDGVISGTTLAISRIENYFTEEQIGKQITISIYAGKVTATRVYIRTNIADSNINSNSIYGGSTGAMSVTITPQSINDYWSVTYGSNANNECILSDFMLNTGSTALPYEPYGIKIPISSGGVTTPVYLGEVQTTRRIKKYEFTGAENFQNISADASIFGVYGLFNEDKYIPRSGAFSTHYNYTPSQSDLVNIMHDNDFVMFKQAESLYNIAFKDTLYSDRTDFKAYLAAQYANGTPVTVWYVLATEETGIVNEPLRKIGDYADTVSGITIPTIAGADTLSIGTTLQPSEVTVNYKGWHPVTDVHERENGAWT